MNNIELLVKHTGDVNFTRLDLFGDETISLTQVVQDVKDPGKVFTNFSKTFSIPASKTNNKFFKHYENFTQDVTYAFDARKKVQAKIELNSLPFQQGKLRLEGVDLKNGKPNIYRVTFFGSLNLKDILGDLKISDLDWLSNFDTTYTSSSLITGMSSSGTGSVTVDSVAYPVPLVTALIGNTQRGFYSSSNTAKYFNTDDEEVNKAGGNLNPSNNVLSGYYFKDLTFSIRLYLIIKAIEKSQSIKARNNNKEILFSTDFFNTTNVSFYNLYMLCQRNAGKKIDGFGSVYIPNQQSGKTYDNATNEHENNLVLRQSSFEIYNLSSTQYFQFAITLNFGSISQNIQVEIQDINTGDIEYATWTSSQTGQTRTYQLGNGNYELRFTSTAQQTVTSFSLIFIDIFDTNTSTTISTSNVDASFVIPGANTSFLIRDNIPEMKVIDFLSGLFKLFNLTAIEEDGKITVKTLDSFYTGGTVRNITEFVDTTSKSVDKALPYKEIVFKYEDTENILAKQHKEINQQDWGAISYNTGEVLDSNNNTYEIVAPFQHMKFERLVDGSTTKNIQVGHLLNDKQDPYLGKPVIFYPIHSSNTGDTMDGFNFITEIDGYDGGSSDADSTQSVYWIPSNSPVVVSSGSGYPETINFNVELNEYTNGADYTDSLFQKYYQSYIVNAFRFNERLTKIKARLPLKFLEQFTLADELQIVDLVYRINSITTNLQTGESTLELLNGREAIAATGSAYATVTISTSSNATPSTACGYTLNNTLYYTGALGNGVRLYTDTGLTTAFSGSGNNYAFPGSNYAAIDSNGYISGYQPCPTLKPTVQTNSATNITYSSFTMNGNISVANGTISDRGFYWGTNSSYASNTKVSEGGTATGTFSKNITSGVTAGTTYYVTAYATNGNGENQGATISFAATNAPNLPTVIKRTELSVTSTGFTARLEITADGGATIDDAGFWMGTDNSAYNAGSNTFYAISPTVTNIGVKTLAFSSLSGSTTYYYWGAASNTYSTSYGISSNYETVTTTAPTYSFNNTYYNLNDAYYACISSNPQTYYSPSSTFQAGIVLYTDSNLTTLAPDGYYSRSNYSYQVDNNDGTLGAQTACTTTTVFRVRLTSAYPGTNYYDMTTVAAAGLSTTNVMYFTAYWGSGRVMYSNVGVTTTYTGSGTWKTDQGSTAFEYSRYPEGKLFFARRQNYINGAWTDLTSTLTDSGYDDYICQVSSAGVLQLIYWNYDTGALVIKGSASMSGIKISSSGSGDAATACSTTPSTIVYYDGTSISNGTVIYTDSASAGTSGSSDKFNGGGNWYKFENNYRAQISSTGVVSNYASC